MTKHNKKSLVLEELYRICKSKKNFIFHNDLVKDVCKKVGFGNPFDATKLDSSDKLPQKFKDENICLLHLGGGYHKFIQGIDKLYHSFESIQDSIQWTYKKSLLNQYNDSESNILSVANNQGILHHFLFFDYNKDKEEQQEMLRKYLDSVTPKVNVNREAFIDKSLVVVDDALYWQNKYYVYIQSAKTYFPHRIKSTLEYFFENEKIEAKNQQIEIDLTIEYDGIIGIFEAKNGTPKDFNIYQIYHPFLYYHNSNLPFKKIVCVYLVREKSEIQDKNNGDILKLWAYTFSNPKRLDSIQFLQSRAYILTQG